MYTQSVASNMKCVILLTLVALSYSYPTTYGSVSKNITIGEDGTIVINRSDGKRITIIKSFGHPGEKNIEISVTGPNIPTKKIEINGESKTINVSDDKREYDQSFEDEIERDKRSSSKNKKKNQGEILAEVLTQYEGVVDDKSYEKLLKKINAYVQAGELHSTIYDILKSLQTQGEGYAPEIVKAGFFEPKGQQGFEQGPFGQPSFLWQQKHGQGAFEQQDYLGQQGYGPIFEPQGYFGQGNGPQGYEQHFGQGYGQGFSGQQGYLGQQELQQKYFKHGNFGYGYPRSPITARVSLDKQQLWYPRGEGLLYGGVGLSDPVSYSVPLRDLLLRRPTNEFSQRDVSPDQFGDEQDFRGNLNQPLGSQQHQSALRYLLQNGPRQQQLSVYPQEKYFGDSYNRGMALTDRYN